MTRRNPNFEQKESARNGAKLTYVSEEFALRTEEGVRSPSGLVCGLGVEGNCDIEQPARRSGFHLRESRPVDERICPRSRALGYATQIFQRRILHRTKSEIHAATVIHSPILT